MTPLDLIVVEYSVKQKCFHKHSLQEMLRKNLEIISRGGNTDYIPIGVFKVNESADAFIRDTREVFDIKKPTQNIENREPNY